MLSARERIIAALQDAGCGLSPQPASVADIMRVTGLSRRYTQGILKELHESGVIRTTYPVWSGPAYRELL